MTLLFLSVPLWAQELESEAYIQQAQSFNFKDIYQEITLKSSIEEGLRKNHQQAIRQFQKEELEIALADAKSSFWLPKLSINLTSDHYRIGTLYDGSRDADDGDEPAGTLSFGFENYTVFNWGIDYLNYQNELRGHKRSQDVLNEEERNLKHNIIIKFFENYYHKEIEKIRKEQLRHASYIYRLNTEKVKLKKVSKQEYLQARNEFLRAQQEYYQANKNSQLADDALAALIGDPSGTRYVINEKLAYHKLTVKAENALAMAHKKNPKILDAQTALDQATRSYQITVREDLPLPKFSINLGAYKHDFGNDFNRTRFETADGDSNIELAASINATWAIWGEDGFLNSRKKAKSLLKKQISEKELDFAKFSLNSQIKQIFRRIFSYQNNIEILTARQTALQKLFDTTLENYMNRKTSFINYGQSLRDLTKSSEDLELSYFQHTQSKILLAKIMGVEDFVGENFENLAQKESR